MEFIINTFSFGQRPEVTIPTPIILETIKEEGIRKLVDNHYQLLRKSAIKDLFPKDDAMFAMVTKHSADFFVQILGGNDYFNQNRGKPLLITRHAAFKITPEARIVWLQCYQEVLKEMNCADEVKSEFWDYINNFSFWMVNKPSEIV